MEVGHQVAIGLLLGFGFAPPLLLKVERRHIGLKDFDRLRLRVGLRCTSADRLIGHVPGVVLDQWRLLAGCKGGYLERSRRGRRSYSSRGIRRAEACDFAAEPGIRGGVRIGIVEGWQAGSLDVDAAAGAEPDVLGTQRQVDALGSGQLDHRVECTGCGVEGFGVYFDAGRSRQNDSSDPELEGAGRRIRPGFVGPRNESTRGDELLGARTARASSSPRQPCEGRGRSRGRRRNAARRGRLRRSPRGGR